MEAFVQELKRVQAIPMDQTRIRQVTSDVANWVIPGRLMCGPRPITKEQVADILADGIDTFVCLQSEATCADYKQLAASDQACRERGIMRSLHFVCYPVEDGSVPSKANFILHLTELLSLLRQGRHLYIHCLGGHGRTGTYVCALMACIYPQLRHLPTCRHWVQATHDMRRHQRTECLGILPFRIAQEECQENLLQDFFALLTFV